MKMMWLWETDGEDRLLSESQFKLKEHVESIYNWKAGAKVTYVPIDTHHTCIHYDGSEVGWLKRVKVI
jgi:hypothetical protein